MFEKPSNFDSLPIRDKLDILLQNELLDPRLVLAVGKLSEELREDNRHPTFYEEALVIFLQDPQAPVERSVIEKELYSHLDTNKAQAVRNLLDRLDDKFIEICQGSNFIVEKELVSSYRLRVREKSYDSSSE